MGQSKISLKKLTSVSIAVKMGHLVLNGPTLTGLGYFRVGP